MKIVLISSRLQAFEDVCEHLERGDRGRVVTRQEGGIQDLRLAADHDQPDVILVECSNLDSGSLSVVERVTDQYPRMAIILIGGQQDPDFLIQAMRVGIREVLVAGASRETVEAAVSRVETKLGLRIRQRSGQVIAFVSSKGGSGATFLSTNLAHQLGSGGKKVLLIDLNLQFGEAILTIHDQAQSSDIAAIARNISRLDASLLHASTVKVSNHFSILAAPEDPAQALLVSSEHLNAILDIAVEEYDFTVLDLNRTLDDLTIRALDRADQIYLVLQAMLPYIRNAKRVLTVFRSLGYVSEKVEVVVNRFGRGAEVGLDDLRASLGPNRIRTVPNGFRDVADAINQGQPLAAIAPSGVVSKAISDWAQALLPKPEPISGGLLSRLLKF
ncbi:MAG: histidine kinase [Betaproteobacteria bacterium]|jgi:pilus assembly protein CpaE|nr:histidine kinase [Betaproteobacteria bacterium]NBY17179.1 histidine kinase [Betaproteobacteria bacterium]